MFSLATMALSAAMLVPTVDIRSDSSSSWRFTQTTSELEPGVRLVRIRAVSDRLSPVPPFTVDVSVPATDCETAWNPNFGCAENLVPLPWWGRVFNIARTQPIQTLLSRRDENRLTLAVGELRRTVHLNPSFDESAFARHVAIGFFREPSEPMTSYETQIRIDLRPVGFADAVSSAAAWQSARAGSAATPPPAAFDAVYSTWYGFHKDLDALRVEDECREAAALGMKVVILDDGWQTDEEARDYASCGDWRVSAKRFPDMRGHVARVQAMGFKYVVWFSMPFVGEETAAYARFRDRMLRHVPELRCWVLDPRFQEVRAYLRDVYLRCLREWNIDGFKLDFVDAFGLDGGTDPAVAQGYAGRDCRSIPDGVEKLLNEVTEALSAEKRGLLLEFRQSYVGPEIRKYGNMMRVGDCPGSALRNRVHIANLRLLCEGSSVHSDMLRWNDGDTPEDARWYILNSIFGTVQYSVVLGKAPDAVKSEIAKWIAFADKHRAALLKGRIRPHRPELNYPVVESESDDERIVVIYDPTVAFDPGPIVKRTLVVDATSGAVTEFAGRENPSRRKR